MERKSDKVLLAAEIISLVAFPLSIIYGFKGEIDKENALQEIQKQRTPLVERYNKEWSSSLDINDLRTYVTFPDLAAKNRNRFVEDHINSEQEVFKTLNDQRSDGATRSVIGLFGVMGSILSFMKLKDARFQRYVEKLNKRPPIAGELKVIPHG